MANISRSVLKRLLTEASQVSLEDYINHNRKHISVTFYYLVCYLIVKNKGSWISSDELLRFISNEIKKHKLGTPTNPQGHFGQLYTFALEDRNAGGSGEVEDFREEYLDIIDRDPNRKPYRYKLVASLYEDIKFIIPNIPPPMPKFPKTLPVSPVSQPVPPPIVQPVPPPVSAVPVAPVQSPVAEDQIRVQVDNLESQENTLEEFNPQSIEDARVRVASAIVKRRGQPAFRRALIAAHKGRCMITDTNAEEVLEAAHIIPYKGDGTNHIRNGLLLRADIHTLFDLGLIAIDSATMTVIVSEVLSNTVYCELQGKKLRLPEWIGAHPSREALDIHRKGAKL